LRRTLSKELGFLVGMEIRVDLKCTGFFRERLV